MKNTFTQALTNSTIVHLSVFSVSFCFRPGQVASCYTCTRQRGACYLSLFYSLAIVAFNHQKLNVLPFNLIQVKERFIFPFWFFFLFSLFVLFYLVVTFRATEFHETLSHDTCTCSECVCVQCVSFLVAFYKC